MRTRFGRLGIVPGLRFTFADGQKAWEEWGFNCGPGALCAALTPEQLRPHLLDFESKRYTNPTLMEDVLNGMGVGWLPGVPER